MKTLTSGADQSNHSLTGAVVKIQVGSLVNSRRGIAENREDLVTPRKVTVPILQA
jgi:hypothetical protein